MNPSLTILQAASCDIHLAIILRVTAKQQSLTS
jgi:hypothetical protein